MKYCIKCVLPDTRPNLFIKENGVCSACIAHANRKMENWKQKKINFLKIVKDIKQKKKPL